MSTTASKQNYQAQKWVAVVSVALLTIKFAAYFFTGSVAILTDALESIANVVAGFIGLYSLYIAAQPKDRNHPYGHGKAEFLSAAVEGTLIAIAGMIILYKAIYQLFHPVTLSKIDLGILLIIITAVVNYIVGTICVRKGRRNNSIALESSGRHLQTDTYSTIAVVIGLVILYFTGQSRIDAFVAIALSLFILYTAYRILRKSIAGIMDEADQQLLSEMVTLLNHNRKNNWVDLHNLRVIKYGAVLHVDCHLTVPWYFNVREAHHEIDILSALIKNKYGETLELFVHADGCQSFQCPLCAKGDCPVRQHPLKKKLPWTLENVIQNEKHKLQLV